MMKRERPPREDNVLAANELPDPETVEPRPPLHCFLGTVDAFGGPRF